jgi:hypothetical protein
MAIVDKAADATAALTSFFMSASFLPRDVTFQI